MESVSKWLLTDAEKDKFIATLTPNLTALRTQAEISQEELEKKNLENMEFVIKEIYAHMKNRSLRNLVEERSGTTPQNISTLKFLDRTSMDYLLEFTQVY